MGSAYICVCLCLWLLLSVAVFACVAFFVHFMTEKHFFCDKLHLSCFRGRSLWMLFFLDQLFVQILWCLYLCLCLCLCLWGSLCAISPKTWPCYSGGGCSAVPVFSLLKMLCLCLWCSLCNLNWSRCSDGGCSAKPDCSKEQDGRCSCKLTVTCNKED